MIVTIVDIDKHGDGTISLFSRNLDRNWKRRTASSRLQAARWLWMNSRANILQYWSEMAFETMRTLRLVQDRATSTSDSLVLKEKRFSRFVALHQLYHSLEDQERENIEMRLLARKEEFPCGLPFQRGLVSGSLMF